VRRDAIVCVTQDANETALVRIDLGEGLFLLVRESAETVVSNCS
jgi:hypothetical protein